jgi:hypothetical protein
MVNNTLAGFIPDVKYQDNYNWILDKIKTIYPYACWSGVTTTYDRFEDNNQAFASVTDTMMIIAMKTQENIAACMKYRNSKGAQCGLFKPEPKVDCMQAVYDIVGRRPSNV